MFETKNIKDCTCPFCGNVLKLHFVDKQDDPNYVGGYFVDCCECSCSLGPFHTPEEAERVARTRI